MSERIQAWRRTAIKHRQDAIAMEHVSLPYAVYAWHQASETALKCAILSTGKSFPKAQDLITLWNDLGKQIPLPPLEAQMIEVMNNLSALDTASRYPIENEFKAHFEILTSETLETAKQTGEFVFKSLEGALPEIFA